MSHQSALMSGSGTSIDIHQLTRVQDPGLATEFHRWPLPDYIWPALERCYHSIFCTEPQLRISGSLTSHVEAWVSRRHGCINAIILFERFKQQLRVLNEVVTLPATILDEFADAVFAIYPELQVVILRAVTIDGLLKRRMTFAAEISDDYVLTLPTDKETWQRSLSSRSREKLRNYLRRVQQRAPTFSFETLSVGEFDLSKIKQVLVLSRARMQTKGKHFGMSAVDEHQLCQLMLERGQLSLINIDGQPRAGLLCTRVGRDVFMHVIAHNPAFDDLRLGYLCCALTIEAAITQGSQQFHFLWGHYDYKTRLGGERQLLSRALIFRYPWQVLLQPGQMIEHMTALLRARLRRMRRR
jgi:hypothetical protein